MLNYQTGMQFPYWNVNYINIVCELKSVNLYHGSDVSLEGDEKFQWVKKKKNYYSKALSVISANQVVLEIRDGEMTTLEYLKLFPIGYSLILKKKS